MSLKNFIAKNGITTGNVTIDATTNDISGVANLTVDGTSNLGPVGNVIITGGSNGQVLTTNGSNVLSWTTISAGNTILNGNSNVSIGTSNGNITMSSAGNANIVVVTGTGANITGTANITGIANIGGNINVTGNMVVTGGLSFNSQSIAMNIGTSQQSASIAVGGALATGTIQIGRSTATQLLVLANGVTGTGNTKTVAIGENGASGSTTNIGVGPALGTGTVTINAGTTVNIANTSGTALQVAGNITGGNLTTTGTTSTGTLIVTGTANLTGASNVSLGAVGNIKITGGSNAQVLTTDGSGNLSWTTPGGGGANINDTTTNGSFYLTMANVTTGTFSNAIISSTKLYFNPSTGQLNATDFNSLSDRTEKANIKQLENAPQAVAQMTGVSFDWVNNDGSSYGLIAQDLEPIAPHAVSTNSEGKKSVNYAAIIPFLVETIKEQQRQIDELSARLDKLEDDGR